MKRFEPLAKPALFTIVAIVLALFSGGDGMIYKAALAVAALAGTWLALRLLDIMIWHGWLVRGGRRGPPKLLTDLFAAFVLIAAAMVLAGNLFNVPVTGLVTTSGVLVAVVGFALRDMLASLFSGIALNIEHPFAIGDWIGLDTGEVGQVIEVSWLTTQLRTKDRVVVVVPNADLATRRFKNYGTKDCEFRTEIEITIDHAIQIERVERLLTYAVNSVPEATTTARQPDLKIKEFSERGIVWRVRFWISDYDRLVDVQYAVQRAILAQLHQAGISLPYRQLDSYTAPMPERQLDLTRHKEQVVARAELFRQLETTELRELAAKAVERDFTKGSIVTEEGEETRSLYIVLEGFLNVTVKDQGAERVLVNQLAAGAFFGEFSLLTGAPRSARVEARSDCVLLEITAEAIAPFLQRCPGLADHLARVLAARQSMTEEAKTRKDADKNKRQQEHQLLSKIKSLFGL